MSLVFESRAEVPEEYRWNMKDIYESDQTWEAAFKTVKTKIKSLADHKNTIADSSSNLLEFIEKMHNLEQELGRLYAYAHMRNDEDKSDSRYQELYDRCRSLLVLFNEAISFFEPELLSISDERISEFLAENKDLTIYSHYLDNIMRVKPHILSESEERILAMSGEIQASAAEIFGVWESADIQFPYIKDEDEKDIRLTNGLYGKYQQHPERRLRKDSYLGLYEPFIQNRNTLATTYGAIIKSHIFNARVRKYESTVEAALDANAVPIEVFLH